MSLCLWTHLVRGVPPPLTKLEYNSRHEERVLQKASPWRAVVVSGVVFGVAISPLFLPKKLAAIPAFAREYQTSCTTCHLDFPKLNDFGKAFKDAGFKFPQGDSDYLKTPPVLLGADAQKLNYPHTVWPGQIPGLPPIGLRMNNFMQFTGNNRSKFNTYSVQNGSTQFVPGNDFETGFFSIFTAGNFGDGIAFWVDDDISVSGDNSAGSLGDAYLKFVDISRLVKMPKDSVSFRVGQFELDLPFTQARTINLSPYDIYQETSIGVVNPLGRQQFVANQFSLANVARGAEVSGGHLYGGYHYSLAVFDQSTSGVPQSGNASPYVPTATASAGGGVGFGSDTNSKDIYARFSYRFNLEHDPESRKAIQAAGATGPRDHTFLNLGTFYVHGDAQTTLAGVNSAPLYANEPFYRVGGDFSFNYRTFNLFGLYMFAHDNDVLPVDGAGTLIPLPFATGAPTPAGFVTGTPVTFSGGFVEADYLVLPWLMLIGRWDGVNSPEDRINALALEQGTPYFGAYDSTRNRFTPGVQVLIRANIKASIEYQIRPLQSLTVVSSPNGTEKAIDPFRVNTLLFATEFVF